MKSSLLRDPNLIVGGDLNLTIFFIEVCGYNSILDPLTKYFKHFFHEMKLIDVFPNQMDPTWINDKVG